MQRIEQIATLMRQLRQVTVTFDAWLCERQASQTPISDKEQRFIDTFDVQLHKAFDALSEIANEEARGAKGREDT